MSNKITSIIFIFIFTANVFPQVCSCVPATSEDTTRLGGNELITIAESKTYKLIQGKVFDGNGEPLEDVLVEVFDKPNWIKENKISPPANQKRLYACFTKKDGTFSFPKLSKSDYEVRFSKDVGWSPTYLFIKINPNSSKASKKLIEIYLNVGI